MLLRAFAASSRRAFHAGRAAPLAVHTINVPSMGDSISEGTLVQVVKAPGDAVFADEVVAVLETDKVSVDVMSPVGGTVVEHFANLEDNVVVGAALFSVDDSRAPAAGSSSSETAPRPPPASSASSEPVASPTSTVSSSSSHRTPLIKFLGKRSLLPAKAPSAAPKMSAVSGLAPPSAGVLPFNHAKKIPISFNEVVAINSGISFL